MNKNIIHLLFVSAAIDLFKNKPDVPEFIKNEPTFDKLDKIKKIFPSIGLNNFSVDVSDKLKNDESNAIPDFVNKLLDKINHLILVGIINSVDSSNSINPDNSKSNSHLYELFANTLSKMNKNSIQFIDGKYKLLLTDNVNFNNKIFFRKDEPIFRVYGKLNEIFKKNLNVSLPELQSLYEFKEFSKRNIGTGIKKYQVVFSSEGDQGAWDICTMSERGISSCQSWNYSGEFNKALLGSILSKYIGIIYLTSGTEVKDRGSKMIKRCLVNFVVDPESRKPYIVINKMYDDLNIKILNIFKNVLKSKTKIPVIYYTEIDFNDATVPKEDLELPTKPYEDFKVNRKEDFENPNIDKLSYSKFIELLQLDEICNNFYHHQRDTFKEKFYNKFSQSYVIIEKISQLFYQYNDSIHGAIRYNDESVAIFNNILNDFKNKNYSIFKLKFEIVKNIFPMFKQIIEENNINFSNKELKYIKNNLNKYGWSEEDVVNYFKDQFTNPNNVNFYISKMKENLTNVFNFIET